jgi:hypothetical protein
VSLGSVGYGYREEVNSIFVPLAFVLSVTSGFNDVTSVSITDTFLIDFINTYPICHLKMLIFNMLNLLLRT